MKQTTRKEKEKSKNGSINPYPAKCFDQARDQFHFSHI